jgi:hypothetical protein
MMLYDPELVDELEDVFHDANDMIAGQIGSRNFRNNAIEEENKGEKDDPALRLTLPFFKDPKIKVSVWKIFKDCIGKDISKMSIPVYFNQPLSILQCCI